MDWISMNATFNNIRQSTQLTETDSSRIRAVIWQNFINGRFSPEQLTDAQIETIVQATIANYLHDASRVYALQVEREIEAWEALKDWTMPLIASYCEGDGLEGKRKRISAVWHNVSIDILQIEFDYLTSFENYIAELVIQCVGVTQLFKPKAISPVGLLDNMNQLPQLTQQILLLHYANDVSLGRIANQLSLPLSVVMQTHFYALEALRNHA